MAQATIAVRWAEFLPQFRPILKQIVENRYFLMGDEYQTALSFGMGPGPSIGMISDWVVDQFREQQAGHYKDLGLEIELAPEAIKDIRKHVEPLIHTLFFEVHKENGGQIVV